MMLIDDERDSSHFHTMQTFDCEQNKKSVMNYIRPGAATFFCLYNTYVNIYLSICRQLNFGPFFRVN